MDNPVIPIFMQNQKGMQADDQLDYENLKEAHKEWLQAASMAVDSAIELKMLGVHKQVVNRLLEPFSTIKVIVTATEWDNFFSLRIHPAAQQEMQLLAIAIKEARDQSTPIKMDAGEWHLPYIYKYEEVLDLSVRKKVSVARCARVSYLNHDKQLDIDKDIKFHDDLLSDRHASPFEHVATPVPFNTTANFVGWSQYRTSVGL
jgi:thymidylate synthase ThyX